MSRREVLRGLAGAAAGLAGCSVVSGCSSLAYRVVAPTAPAGGAVPVRSTPPSTTTMTGVTQPAPNGPVVAATMTVGTEVVGSFGQGFVGLAYEKSAIAGPLFAPSNAPLIALFKLLGPGVLSIGGASVDESVWAADGKGGVQGQIAPADVDALALFLQATGWSCVYGVNLGGSATGATTAQLAAAEVAYVSQQLGPLLLGVEIGNACERYGDAGSYYAGQWTVEAFEALWKQYRAAIVTAVPRVAIMGPAAAAAVVDIWTLPFAEYVTADEVSLLTQHCCGLADTTASPEDLLTNGVGVAEALLPLRYGAQSVGVPFRITRCNALDSGGVEGISDTYASALWALDAVFGCALGGADGVNFTCGSGDAGAALVNDGSVVTAVQPMFNGMLLASMMGEGTMVSAQVDAGSLNVSGYAIQRADGGFSVMMVNKDATQNLNLSIALPGDVNGATLVQMTQASGTGATPSLSASSGIAIQGASVATNGSFHSGLPFSLTTGAAQVSCYVPALSAVLVRIV